MAGRSETLGAVSIAEPATAPTDGDVLDSRRAGGMFLRGSGLRIVAYAGAVLSSIAATPLVSRHLGRVGYGRYVTVTSLMLIVLALSEGGLANLGVREFSTGDERERRAFMRNLIGLRIVLSGAGAIAAVGFAVLAGYPAVMIAGTAIAGAGLVLATLQGTIALPLTTGLRLGWLAVLDFLGPMTTAIALIVLVVAGASLLPFYGAAVLAAVTTLALSAALVHGRITLLPAFDRRRWRELLRQSLVFAAATSLGTIYFQVVVVAMSLLARGGAVGVFAMAFRILSVVNGIPLLVVGSAFPILLRAARDDRARLRYALQRLFEGQLLLGGWFSLVLFAAAHFAVAVMGGGKFRGSTELLRILAPGIIATYLSAVGMFALLSVRRYRELIAINAVMVATAVVLSVTLIPAHGATGGAIVTLSLEVVLAAGAGGTLFACQPELRPQLGTLARIVLALALGYAAAAATPLSPLLDALAGSAVLAAAVLALGLVPRELAHALRERTGRRPVD
jgi:O-antigen/teichoic acid export membrane protein